MWHAKTNKKRNDGALGVPAGAAFSTRNTSADLAFTVTSRSPGLGQSQILPSEGVQRKPNLLVASLFTETWQPDADLILAPKEFIMCEERRGVSGLQLCRLETIWVALREQIMQSPPNADHLNPSQFDVDKKLLKDPEDERHPLHPMQTLALSYLVTHILESSLHLSKLPTAVCLRGTCLLVLLQMTPSAPAIKEQYDSWLRPLIDPPISV